LLTQALFICNLNYRHFASSSKTIQGVIIMQLNNTHHEDHQVFYPGDADTQYHGIHILFRPKARGVRFHQHTQRHCVVPARRGSDTAVHAFTSGGALKFVATRKTTRRSAEMTQYFFGFDEQPGIPFLSHLPRFLQWTGNPGTFLKNLVPDVVREVANVSGNPVHRQSDWLGAEVSKDVLLEQLLGDTLGLTRRDEQKQHSSHLLLGTRHSLLFGSGCCHLHEMTYSDGRPQTFLAFEDGQADLHAPDHATSTISPAEGHRFILAPMGIPGRSMD